MLFPSSPSRVVPGLRWSAARGSIESGDTPAQLSNTLQVFLRHTTGQIEWRYDSKDTNKNLEVITKQVFGAAIGGRDYSKKGLPIILDRIPPSFRQRNAFEIAC